MDSGLQTLEYILKKEKHHITVHRRAVFKMLYGKKPLSMHELHQELKHTMDRTSIYRTIELFEKLGIIHRIQIGWKYKIELSDIFVAHHHHIRCLKCGRIIELAEDKRIEALIADIAATNNIQNPVHQLEIQGSCNDCSSKMTGE